MGKLKLSVREARSPLRNRVMVRSKLVATKTQEIVVGGDVFCRQNVRIAHLLTFCNRIVLISSVLVYLDLANLFDR